MKAARNSLFARPDDGATVASPALWNTNARRSACALPEASGSIAPLAASSRAASMRGCAAGDPHRQLLIARDSLPSAQAQGGPAIAPTPTIDCEWAMAYWTANAAPDETPEIATSLALPPRLSPRPSSALVSAAAGASAAKQISARSRLWSARRTRGIIEWLQAVRDAIEASFDLTAGARLASVMPAALDTRERR